MMKMIAILVVCNLIGMKLINAEECYVCDASSCEHPTSADIKDCSESADGGRSGKAFVAGALGKSSVDMYTSIKNSLDAHVQSLSLNTTTINWGVLTRWACYVTKDKHRGCFIMGKGLCSGDKSVLGLMANIGDKVANIMSKVKDTIKSMFKDIQATDDQKTNITQWMAENYMSNLVNNDKGEQFQLDTCCEGDKCNYASMIHKSTAVLLVLLLSIYILV